MWMNNQRCLNPRNVLRREPIALHHISPTLMLRISFSLTAFAGEPFQTMFELAHWYYSTQGDVESERHSAPPRCPDSTISKQ